MQTTGKADLLPAVDPNDDTSPIFWGTLLEPIVAAHDTKHTGNKVRRVNAVLQHSKFLSASPAGQFCVEISIEGLSSGARCQSLRTVRPARGDG